MSSLCCSSKFLGHVWQPTGYYRVVDQLGTRLEYTPEKEYAHNNAYLTLERIYCNMRQLRSSDAWRVDCRTIACVQDIFQRYMQSKAHKQGFSLSKITDKILNLVGIDHWLGLVSSVPVEPRKVHEVFLKIVGGYFSDLVILFPKKDHDQVIQQILSFIKLTRVPSGFPYVNPRESTVLLNISNVLTLVPPSFRMIVLVKFLQESIKIEIDPLDLPLKFFTSLFDHDADMGAQVKIYWEQQVDEFLSEEAIGNQSGNSQFNALNLEKVIRCTVKDLDADFEVKLKQLQALYQLNFMKEIYPYLKEAVELFPQEKRAKISKNIDLLVGLKLFPAITLILFKLIPRESRSANLFLLREALKSDLGMGKYLHPWQNLVERLSLLPEEFRCDVFIQMMNDSNDAHKRVEFQTSILLKGSVIYERFDPATRMLRDLVKIHPIVHNKTMQSIESELAKYLALENPEEMSKEERDHLILWGRNLLESREVLKLKSRIVDQVWNLMHFFQLYFELVPLFPLEHRKVLRNELMASNSQKNVSQEQVEKTIIWLKSDLSLYISDQYQLMVLILEDQRMANLIKVDRIVVERFKEYPRVARMRIFRELSLFPESMIPEIIDELLLNKFHVNWIGCIFAYFLERNPNLLPKIHEHIDNKLERYLQGDPNGEMTSRQRSEAYEFSKVLCVFERMNFGNNQFHVSPYQSWLRLEIDHPILIRAGAVMFKFDLTSAKIFTNPYYLSTKLQEIAAAEERIKTGPQSQIVLSIVIDEHTYSTVRVNVALNFEELQKRAKNNAYTVDMLPKLPDGFALTFFDQLFDELTWRLPTLALEKRDAFINHMRLLLGLSEDKILEGLPLEADPGIFVLINKIKEHSLGQSARLPRLLKVKDDTKAPISNYTFYLYSILKSFVDESAVVEEGGILSAREERALVFLTRVRECATGQEEGIAEYYNGLESKYKQGNALLGPIERVNKRVETVVDDFLNACISKQLTLDNLTDMPVGQHVTQQVHQIRYINNRYGHQLGLVYRHVFEQHPAAVSKSLLACTVHMDDPDNGPIAKEMLNRLVGFLSPSHLINQLKESFILAANKSRDVILQQDRVLESKKKNLDEEVRLGIKTSEERYRVYQEARQASKEQKEMIFRQERLVTEQDLTQYLDDVVTFNAKGDKEWEKYLIYNEESEFGGVSDIGIYQICKKMNLLIGENL